MSANMTEASGLTVNDFYIRLSSKVSDYNAKLTLQSALIATGLNALGSNELNKEDAKTICLELIKKGGPAFQVGKDVYQLMQ